MINKLLRTLGPTKGTFAITGFAILFSTVLYLISCIFYGGIYVWGLIKAAIIPAIAAPIPSYLLLRVAIRLALSEENLWKSEKKYRKILESIEEGYFEVDLEGNFTSLMNPCTK
jgi:PAS domain-containing protein